MEKYEKILIELNIPLIPETNPLFTKHKIFQKYTSHPYYKYAFDLLDTLCQKTNYENKKHLQHISFTYLTYILYNCGNIPYLNNLDLMILCCFYLAVKAFVKQNTIPGLNRLKKIYSEKYINYKNEEIVKAEIICVKLLKYKINFLTVYDCLYYLLYNNKELFNIALKKFETEKVLNIKEYMNKKPLDLAKEIIHSIDIKIKLKYPKIIKKKILLNYNNTNINTKKNKYQNSTSRISTSNYSNNNNKEQINNDNNPNNIIYNKYTTINHLKNAKTFLILPKTEKHFSIYKKNSLKKNKNNSKGLSLSNLVNSFTNLDIELNSSPFNNTNCSSSPCGSDGLPSSVNQNNTGININNNSPNEGLKKSFLYKKNMKTSFVLNKKNARYIDTKSNLDITRDKILEEKTFDNIKDIYLSCTFYSKRKRNDFNDYKIGLVNYQS